MNNQKTKKGFTIIEVVLVLAIAGLIFLMVFIALPALQRSQRDTQRRNDYAMLSTAITNYMTNNRGKLPTNASATKFTDGVYAGGLNPATYINADGTDPNGFNYKIEIVKCTKTSVVDSVCELDSNASSVSSIPVKMPVADGRDITVTTVYVATNADCSGTDGDGNAVPTYNASTRAFAIYGPLETTGSYCNNSQ